MQLEAVIGMDALSRWSVIVNTQRRQIKVDAGRPAQQVYLVHEYNAGEGKSFEEGDQTWELEERQTHREECYGMVVESILAHTSATGAKAPQWCDGYKAGMSRPELKAERKADTTGGSGRPWDDGKVHPGSHLGL